MLKTHQKFFEAASRYLQVLRVGRADFFFCECVGVRVGVSRAFFFLRECVSVLSLMSFFFLDVQVVPCSAHSSHICASHTRTIRLRPHALVTRGLMHW